MFNLGSFENQTTEVWNCPPRLAGSECCRVIIVILYSESLTLICSVHAFCPKTLTSKVLDHKKHEKL